MSYRARFTLGVLGAVVLLFVLNTVYEGFQTLNRLDVIEAERDLWQRPSDIVRALNLMPGGVVVDFGSGSGYFALKLSSEVGLSGKVLAVDVRRLSLAFLWLRALMKRQHNIREMVVEPGNARLPAGASNAVLILNTYHELSDRPAILNQIFRSLVSGGRLVIVDPMHTEYGDLSPTTVEEELRARGFELVSRENQFIEQPAGAVWWLVTARRP